MPGLWRTPLTWAIGLVTDTMMNQHIRDQLSALKNDHMLCCGRLTLTTNVPIPTSDVTGATTVYFTPFRGNLIAVHDGDHWQVLAFSQLAIALGSDAANTNYDVFAYYSSGAVAIERTAWTNDSTRAVALTTLDGVYVKSSDTTRRYIGTYRTTGTVGQTEDSASKRLVWNYYNRVPRNLRVLETTDSWTYTTAARRQANNNTANQVAVVIGVAEVAVNVFVSVVGSNTTAGVNFSASIGADSTSTEAANVIMNYTTAQVAGYGIAAAASLVTMPAAGYHFYAWLEYSNASGTTTWYGDAAVPTVMQSGIFGRTEA